MINMLRRIIPSNVAWQATQPGELGPSTGVAWAGHRPQPPLREVLQGLDVRELDGETLFDQLFGPPPGIQASGLRR